MPNSFLSLEFLLMLLLGLPVAATTGFVTGIFFERTRAVRFLRRAKRHVEQLFDVVVGRLDSAAEACSLLEQVPNVTLAETQLQRLNDSQGKVTDILQKLVVRESKRHEKEAVEREKRAEMVREAAEFSWVLEPADPRSGLPNRQAAEANLAVLLEACRNSRIAGGLLLVQIDKFHNLCSRFGKNEASHFLATVASLATRQLEADDFLAQCSDDTLVILVKPHDSQRGSLLANSIRNSIRNHHFRLNNGDVEVLVTASLGYSAVTPDDNAALAMQRASDALIRSQRRGRNQLHVYDGTSLTHFELANSA